MPIKLPEDLPAYDVLTREGVMVMGEDRAARQDIRPLRIGLLNLMPKKIQTETQFARLIGATPLQIELSLIRMTEHQTKTTAAEHMEASTAPSPRSRPGEKFDGLDHHRRADRASALRRGHLLGRAAPRLRLDADQRPFHLRRLLGRHGDDPPFPRHREAHAARKAFGCFRHRNLAPASPYLRGFLRRPA